MYDYNNNKNSNNDDGGYNDNVCSSTPNAEDTPLSIIICMYLHNIGSYIISAANALYTNIIYNYSTLGRWIYR